MNRSNIFASNGLFKPASFYLSSASRDASPHRKSPSLDDSDTEAGRGIYKMRVTDDNEPQQSTTGSGFLTPDPTAQSTATPLVDISRSPSPFARSKSAVQSEDEDDFELGDVAQSRPLVTKDSRGSPSRATMTAKQVLQKGGVGQFLYGTAIGWRVYLGLLIFWVGGCQFGLLLMNRFIFWTGTYKFPYPLTMTLMQLAMTHVLLLASASLTRGLEKPLHKIGLAYLVAPSQAYSRGNRATRYRGGSRHKSVWANVMRWLTHGSGGISGGGLFEWQWQSARHVLPVAIIFVAKVVLSNLSYAYAVLPMYMLSRIAILPLTLALTSVLLKQAYSIQTLSATLTATLNLLLAIIRPGERITWESVVAGVFSSLFAALYPIVLLRAYRNLVSDLVPQGDILSVADDSNPSNISTGTKEETRAYWRVLHYTSILTMLFLFPLVLVSGELKQISRNCYFMDVPWFWFLMACGGVGSWAVFSTTLLLIKATSPLTATFISVPRSAFQLVVLSKFRMPAHSWVGVSLCLTACFWFLVAKAREGRGRIFGRD